MEFNSSITQAAAKAMEHLSEFVFVTMGNLTLVRRDAYLSHLRTGIKPDTLTALRSAPLHISTLFPDWVIKRAEEDIAQLESKGHACGSQNKGRYHPYERHDKKLVNRDSRLDKPAWKTIGRKQFRRGRGHTTTFSSWAAKGQQSYKWQLLCSQVTDTTAGREHTTDNKLWFKFKLVFSKYPFWWDRVGIDFSGRVPGYSRRWAIIGDTTKIYTFTNLKHTQIMGSNHLLYFSSATFFAFKTVRQRRNVNQEKISVHSKHGCLLQCP